MVILHVLLAASAILAIWFLSGVLIDAVDRVAHRYHKPGFFVAFFILGFLTSIGEISVAVNSSFEGVPQVSAGNLVGASFVIFLLIIPLLAIAGNGIAMRLVLTRRSLALLLFVVLLPAFFALDGGVSRREGIVMLLLYTTLLFAVRKRQPSEEIVRETVAGVQDALAHKHRATALDVGKVFIGAVVIFFAGKILVEEAVFFSQLCKVPPSFIGLLLLSIGTNIPELAIALRCVLGRQKHIAFGDYLGSAAANTLLFGALPIVNGDFIVEHSEFLFTFFLFVIGLVLFFWFSQTKSLLSRREGIVLITFYGLFLIAQAFNITQVIPQVYGFAGGA